MAAVVRRGDHRSVHAARTPCCTARPPSLSVVRRIAFGPGAAALPASAVSGPSPPDSLLLLRLLLLLPLVVVTFLVLRRPRGAGAAVGPLLALDDMAVEQERVVARWTKRVAGSKNKEEDEAGSDGDNATETLSEAEWALCDEEQRPFADFQGDKDFLERMQGRLHWLQSLLQRRDRPIVLLLELCNRFSLAHDVGDGGPTNGIGVQGGRRRRRRRRRRRQQQQQQQQR